MIRRAARASTWYSGSPGKSPGGITPRPPVAFRSPRMASDVVRSLVSASLRRRRPRWPRAARVAGGRAGGPGTGPVTSPPLAELPIFTGFVRHDGRLHPAHPPVHNRLVGRPARQRSERPAGTGRGRRGRRGRLPPLGRAGRETGLGPADPAVGGNGLGGLARGGGTAWPAPGSWAWPTEFSCSPGRCSCSSASTASPGTAAGLPLALEPDRRGAVPRRAGGRRRPAAPSLTAGAGACGPTTGRRSAGPTAAARSVASPSRPTGTRPRRVRSGGTASARVVLGGGGRRAAVHSGTAGRVGGRRLLRRDEWRGGLGSRGRRPLERRHGRRRPARPRRPSRKAGCYALGATGLLNCLDAATGAAVVARHHRGFGGEPPSGASRASPSSPAAW